MTNEISTAQLEANRKNAQQSTGPKTEEGKAQARYNARRHGLTGQFYCMSETDEAAYATFEANILGDLKPVGPYENQLAISIIQDQWRLNRSRAVEFNLYGRGHDELTEAVHAPSESTHAAATMADTYRNESRIFANIALYETRIHRMIAKNEGRLKELQTERKAAHQKALQEAESLVRFADFIDEADAITKNIEINGFVFSPAEIIAKIQRDHRLRQAKACALYGWDPKNPNLRDILKTA